MIVSPTARWRVAARRSYSRSRFWTARATAGCVWPRISPLRPPAASTASNTKWSVCHVVEDRAFHCRLSGLSSQRGILVDTARHFMPVVQLERLLHELASAKMNVNTAVPCTPRSYCWRGANGEEEKADAKQRMRGRESTEGVRLFQPLTALMAWGATSGAASAPDRRCRVPTRATVHRPHTPPPCADARCRILL